MCRNSQRKEKKEGELSATKCENSFIKVGTGLAQEEGGPDGARHNPKHQYGLGQGTGNIETTGKCLGCSPDHTGSCRKMRKPCWWPVTQALPSRQFNSSPLPGNSCLSDGPPRKASGRVLAQLGSQVYHWTIPVSGRFLAFAPVSLLFLDSRGFYPLRFLARHGSWATVGVGKRVDPSPRKHLECIFLADYPEWFCYQKKEKGR